MVSYSIKIDNKSYLINVNQSRRSFTMTVYEFFAFCKKCKRIYHGQSFVQSMTRFQNLCSYFHRLQCHQDDPDFDPGIDFYSVLQIFPDYI